MNKILLIVVLLLISGATVKANPLVDSLKVTYSPDSSYLQDNFVSLNLILPGVSFEKKIGKNSTLYSSAGITTSYSINQSLKESGFSGETRAFVNPFIELNYRNYYNFERRIKKSKNVKHNSANYFGVLGTYVFNPIGDNNNAKINYFELGPVWGFQRVYQSGFYLDLNLGLGYYQASSNLGVWESSSNGSFRYWDQTMKTNGINFIGMLHLGFYIGKK